MARFKLLAPHYLVVDGTEWEQKEIDQGTGKEIRKRYKVPKMFHTDDPGDWNYPYISPTTGKAYGGEIIVATEFSPLFPRDVVFFGPPTPEMEPLDDEAKEMVATFKHNWQEIADSPASQGTYSERLIDDFLKQQAEIAMKQSSPNSDMMALMKQMADALALLATASTKSERRAI